MSRLSEMQEMEITKRIQTLEARLIELKLTPQATSNRSGVLTYQVPEADNWQTVEWTDHLGNISMVDEMILPPLPQNFQQNRVEITATFEPDNQANPILYPYLIVSIDGAPWTPYYSPSLGLGFSAASDSSGIGTFVSYNEDQTDYGDERPVYKFYTLAYYNTKTNSVNPRLRVKFRLRSTDKGKVSVAVRTYKDF